MYIVNESFNTRGPNATFIPPASVGLALGHGGEGGGLWVGSVRVFGYKHVGIGNSKVSRWGYSPIRSPNASGFALQWNIGFSL